MILLQIADSEVLQKTSMAHRRLLAQQDEESRLIMEEGRIRKEREEASERLRLSEMAARQARQQTILFVSGTCALVLMFIAHMYLDIIVVVNSLFCTFSTH